jgi:hypothetical protein
MKALVNALVLAARAERDEFHERCNNSYSTEALMLAKERVARCKQDLLNAVDGLRTFVDELAGEDCEYGEASPDACAGSRRHYRCLPCKAKATLLSADRSDK